MTESQVVTALWAGAFLLVHLGVMARVILRPHREPASRIAWIVVMIVLPVIGILTYILLGETSIGRRRVSRICAVLATMPDLTKAPGMDSPNLQPKVPETYAHLFRLGHSVNGFEPVGGNCATLLPDSNATIESMVADIDASQDPQVIGTGPTVYNSAMPEVFETLLYTARRELVITTPYYVPDEAMQTALCASARRGVRTTIIFPARNDSWIVAAASRSYYCDLLAAGVRIYEYEGGLLHTKSLTLDGEVTLIGSANMDRRSFDLNYENNILFYDPTLTAEMRRRQDAYLACSHPVTAETVAQWSMTRRLWNNTIAMLGPIL